LTDRFGQSTQAFEGGLQGQLALNRYESTINTILVHAGLSLHFDIMP
jgi:hypothetical protein